jgi:putative Mg2+ transporter-C (MgtC) family protein
MMMPFQPSWTDIALRLLLTMLAGAVIGFDRAARGHAAGLRTMILVGLAGAVAMIQTNILLSLTGKTPESFSQMDLMRLPLGILTGVGFIGGGAIMKKGDLVTGVTTAATLWLMTVIGLCFGGGQLVLGIVATGLGVFTLQVLKAVDRMVPRELHARLVLSGDPEQDVPDDLARVLAGLGCRSDFLGRTRGASGTADYKFEPSWRRKDSTVLPRAVLEALDQRFQIREFALSDH